MLFVLAQILAHGSREEPRFGPALIRSLFARKGDCVRIRVLALENGQEQNQQQSLECEEGNDYSFGFLNGFVNEEREEG